MSSICNSSIGGSINKALLFPEFSNSPSCIIASYIIGLKDTGLGVPAT